MGNYDERRRHPMAWQSTLGEMKRYGTVVIQTGCGCGFSGEVDLDYMIGLLCGEDMSLWDCRPPCPLCGDLMHFMASPGRGTPFRPLQSAFGYRDPEQLPPQAWQAGWLGKR